MTTFYKSFILGCPCSHGWGAKFFGYLFTFMTGERTKGGDTFGLIPCAGLTGETTKFMTFANAAVAFHSCKELFKG